MYDSLMRVLGSLLDLILKGASYVVAYYYGKQQERDRLEKEALLKEVELRKLNEQARVDVRKMSPDELERYLESNGWFR